MVTFTEMRPPSFRTKLLSLEQAASFARCLSGNRKFAEVEIVTSRRAKGEARYFVRYQPSNPVRQDALLNREQSARIERAEAESFMFCQDTDHDFVHCLSHGSGEVYEVTLWSCNCPDAQFRALPNGLACKHSLALADALRRGEVQEFQPVPSAEERRAAERKRDNDRFAEIFADTNDGWLR